MANRWAAVVGWSWLVAGCGGLPVVQGSAQVKGLCTQLPEVSIPAAPMPLAGAFSANFTYPVDAQLDRAFGSHVTPATLSLDSLTLRATRGIPDFSFLNSLTLDVGTGTGAVEALMSYSFAPGSPGTGPLVLKADSPANLVRAIDGGALTAFLTLKGSMPMSAWGFIATPCISAKVDLEY